MMRLFHTMRLSVKIALLGGSAVFLASAALVLLSVWQSGQYNALAQGEVDALIEADLDHITQGVFNLVQTENEAVQEQVNGNLRVARHLLTKAGGASLGEKTVTWTMVNQLTRDVQSAVLPQFLIGNQWIGQVRQADTVSSMVDEVARLVGGSATLFQRINERGDMLRVATTVRATPSERAIGTYIPAVQPDGSDNPVIAAILKGQTYRGRAYVVNDWYLTAYEPLYDSAGQLIGMLYVGVQQHFVASRIRQAILQTSVGKTGYVYIIGGRGEDRGRYIISAKGERDGEDIWDIRDSDDRLVIQEIINTAIQLQPGAVATVRYRWQNRGEDEPRWKIARIAYYSPWDWVIGTSVYEDELQGYSNVLTEGRSQMVVIMVLAGCAITLCAGLFCLAVMWRVTSPIRRMTEVAQALSQGDFSQVIPVTSGDEIGILAQTFNRMSEELRRFTREIRQSEEKYRGIVENALEGVYQSSLDGRFLSVNPALAEILGYASPEELMASITDIRNQFYVDPGDRDVLLKAIMAERKTFGFEVQCYRKDGRIIWVEISARLRYDETGAPDVIEGFMSDITSRKRAEEALAESRNYLDEIINSFGDPLFVKDENHRWVLVNSAFCAMMGRSREQLIGKSDYDFFPKEQAEIFWAKDAEVFASGIENLNEELFNDGHGINRTILTKKTLYTDKNGQKFIVGSIRDVTELKQQEAEKIRLVARLNQAQKMEAIGALAGGIAHDFNNILQPMLGYSEMLGLHLPPDSPHRRYVERLQTAGLRAKELVSHILAFSRQTEHKVIPVRLQEILKEVVQLCRSTIPANIEIVTDLQRNCPPVSVDPSQVHQVAMNLIVNAFHAVETTGGRITVSVREETLKSEEIGDLSLQPGRYLALAISDTGCGIPAEVRDRIFEPYFTTKEQGRGTGLGLAVVHGIVKEWQGDIAIASTIGQGTTMTVFLPLPEQSAEIEMLEAMPQYPGGRERILLVDDEAMIVELATLILKELGYQVTARTNSRQALELFTSNPQAFDLVITDMMMPEMTGDQLSRALLAINPALPIIMCSGFSEHTGKEEILGIGVKDLLMKPITIAEMSQKVRTVLDAARSGRHEEQQGEQQKR